ncbi:MAG: hypothetical protein WBM35_09575 [Candidatus Electrothrix sp.]|jgi:hypothetical protein
MRDVIYLLFYLLTTLAELIKPGEASNESIVCSIHQEEARAKGTIK